MVRYGADLPVDVIEANIASAIDLVVQTARALDAVSYTHLYRERPAGNTVEQALLRYVREGSFYARQNALEDVYKRQPQARPRWRTFCCAWACRW